MADKYRKIGEVLAAARLEQKRSIKEAAEVTKIKEAYLAAVESGQPEDLPSEPYFMLFARSYAQFLGIDTAIFEEIMELENGPSTNIGETAEIAEDTSKKQARSFGRSLIILVVIVIILFAGLIIYSQFIVKRAGQDFEPADRMSTGEVERDEIKAPKTILETEFDSEFDPYQQPEKLELVVRAKQDVWMMVVRDGDTVLNRQLAAGDVRKWEANYRFVLTMGISTAVDLTLNGVILPPLTAQAQTISGLEINQVNYHRFLTAETIPVSQPKTVTSAAKRPEPIQALPVETYEQAGQISADSADSGRTGEADGD